MKKDPGTGKSVVPAATVNLDGLLDQYMAEAATQNWGIHVEDVLISS
jgi:hypothetical protein